MTFFRAGVAERAWLSGSERTNEKLRNAHGHVGLVFVSKPLGGKPSILLNNDTTKPLIKWEIRTWEKGLC